MQFKRTKGMFLILGFVGCLTIPTYGEQWDCSWVHPCDETNLTCGGWDCCPLECSSYFCVAEWDVSTNWTGVLLQCNGFPDSPTESAIIRHSNTGTCDGGSNDGQPCSEDNDCPPITQSPSTCENVEDDVDIEIPTITIEALKIETKSTSATNDILTINFKPKDPAGNTLTAGSITV